MTGGSCSFSAAVNFSRIRHFLRDFEISLFCYYSDYSYKHASILYEKRGKKIIDLKRT